MVFNKAVEQIPQNAMEAATMKDYNLRIVLTDDQQQELDALVTACNNQRGTQLTAEGLLSTILYDGLSNRLSSAWELLHVNRE